MDLLLAVQENSFQQLKDVAADLHIPISVLNPCLFHQEDAINSMVSFRNKVFFFYNIQISNLLLMEIKNIRFIKIISNFKILFYSKLIINI